MPAYLVTLDRTKSGHTLVQGADAMVVFAASTTAAKQAAAAKYEGDGLAWLNDSTATEIVAGTDWSGWTFRVAILGGFGTGGDEPRTVAVVGDATDNTVDEIAAALVVALNALDGIANAAYNATTNTLTVAAAADALGDQKLEVSIIPPGGSASIASLVGTITDGGVAAADLTVVLPADNAVIPNVLAPVAQV
ncbi:virion structural protein [Pseudomonas phage M6]|uniref:virion structural protein n=1 Tax=Pseudomonas phage M6 TaxID=2911432 RepID=UPI00015543F2|nr:virion structural protein [Pseudomonas phage M6]